MIIGISGKMGSGKDTVGKIIQYLTFLEIVKEDLDYPERDYWLNLTFERMKVNLSIWKIKKFAAEVKKICSLLTGIPVKDFEKEEVKSSYLGDEWNTYDETKIKNWLLIKFTRKQIDSDNTIFLDNYRNSPIGIKRFTVRELLQRVGTDAMRDIVHRDVWVNALMKDYISKSNELYCQGGKSSPDWNGKEYPNWLVTDVRFPNEAKVIKDRGGIIVRVNRPSVRKEEVTNALTGEKDYFHVHYPKDEHPSETALDDYQFDCIIDNYGSIEDLIRKTKEFLISFNLL